MVRGSQTDVWIGGRGEWAGAGEQWKGCRETFVESDGPVQSVGRSVVWRWLSETLRVDGSQGVSERKARVRWVDSGRWVDRRKHYTHHMAGLISCPNQANSCDIIVVWDPH